MRFSDSVSMAKTAQVYLKMRFGPTPTARDAAHRAVNTPMKGDTFVVLPARDISHAIQMHAGLIESYHAHRLRSAITLPDQLRLEAIDHEPPTLHEKDLNLLAIPI